MTESTEVPAVSATAPRSFRPPGAGPARVALDRLLPLALDPLPADAALRQQAIVLRLERALRAERARANAGHRAYDVVRHAALAAALRTEKARLNGP